MSDVVAVVVSAAWLFMGEVISLWHNVEEKIVATMMSGNNMRIDDFIS